MRVLLQTFTALLALVAIAAAAPTVEKPRSRFTLQQGDRIRAPRSPAANYMRALRKFQNKVPDIVVAALQAETGTAEAVPEEFDSEYLTPITIGGQGVHVAIDTGSTDLWVFSNDLSAADRGDHGFYTPGNSSAKIEGATWRVRYGDGTTASGDVYTDDVTVANITSPDQAFGAASRVSEEFIRDENNDGIMGLSFTSLSMMQPERQPGWFENVKDDLAKPLYAVTLKRNAPGTFDFGFIDENKYQGEIKYVTVNSSEGFWSVTTQGYQVSNATVQNTPITGIVDTGTSLLLIPETVAEAYYAQVPNSEIGPMTGGYEFPCNTSMPDFSLVFGQNNATQYRATVPGEYVKYQPLLPGSSTCFGGIQAAGDPDFSIFGDVLLKSQFVVFDSRGPILGWANQA